MSENVGPASPRERSGLVKSRQRVIDHGEVFTPRWLVDDMLDLVADEVARIESRVLEPACGSGNFLVPVLERKLATVDRLHSGSAAQRCHHALVAATTIYGIELLADNVAECRTNLLRVLTDFVGGTEPPGGFLDAAREILSANIVHGDALAMTTGGTGEPLAFEAWEDTGDECLMRHTVRYDQLVHAAAPSPRAFGHDHKPEAFGHDHKPEAFGFGVVVGNPPYQLDDAGHGSSAGPIYHRFIEQAIAVDPRLVTMVVPARWLTGGKGLSKFRGAMLGDRRLRAMTIYDDSRMCFDGVEVAGGILYFVWDRKWHGDCVITHHDKALGTSCVKRPLVEPNSDVFIRSNAAVAIVAKVSGLRGTENGTERTADHDATAPPRLSSIVSARNPFGFPSNFRGQTRPQSDSDVQIFQNGGIGWVPRGDVAKGTELIDRWKVLISYSSHEHAGQSDRNGTKRVLARIEPMPPGFIGTESYLVAGAFAEESTAHNLITYLLTRFVRFLVSQLVTTQHVTRGSFALVPLPDLSQPWSDEALYRHHDLSDAEVAVIEALIRPMPMDRADA